MAPGRRSGTGNTPSLLNVRHYARFGLTGAETDLARQATAPFFRDDEHGLTGWPELLDKLNSLPEYRPWRTVAPSAFALPSHGYAPDIGREQVAAALLAYLGTLRPAESAFDRWRTGQGRLTVDEKKGYRLFVGRGGCASCHLTGGRAPLTDSKAHAGLLSWPTLSAVQRRAVDTLRFQRLAGDYVEGQQSAEVAALGLFLSTRNPEDIGRWRTASLRGMAQSAPYLHDGSAPDMVSAVRVEASLRNTGRRPPLTQREIQWIAAFLRTLWARWTAAFANNSSLSCAASVIGSYTRWLIVGSWCWCRCGTPRSQRGVRCR